MRTTDIQDETFIESSADGGEAGSETYDSTRRINVDSYQRASYGEIMRIYARHDRSKQMLAWYKAFCAGTFTFNSGTGYFTSSGHKLENGDQIVLSSTGTLPTGFSAGTADKYEKTSGTAYYVINKTSSTFQLSTSRGGSAVNGSSSGTGTMSFVAIPTVKAWAGWHYNPHDEYDGTSPHDHWSIEANDASGLQRTRFEMVTINADTTEVNTANSNFTVRSGILGVSNSDGSNKRISIFTASGIIDAKQITVDSSSIFGAADATTKRNKILQTFTATTTRYDGVRLYKQADTGTFTGTVTISLYATSGFLPTGGALGTVTLSNGTWTGTAVGEFTATFTSGVTGLTSGNSYALVVECSTADDSNHPNLGINSVTTAYTGGILKYWNTTDGWTNTTEDFYFKMLMPTSGVTRNKSVRWQLRGSDDIEMNQWDGTEFELVRYDNDGANETMVLSIDRNTGDVTVSANLSVLGALRAISAAAPAGSGSAGIVGEIRYDTSYMYICVATNTWRRVAVSSF